MKPGFWFNVFIVNQTAFKIGHCHKWMKMIYIYIILLYILLRQCKMCMVVKRARLNE